MTWMMAVAIAAWVFHARAAVAQQATLGLQQLQGRYMQLVVDGEAGSFEVPVHPETLTAVHFASHIVDVQYLPRQEFDVKQLEDILLVAPKEDTKIGQSAVVQVVTMREHVSLEFTRAEDSQMAPALAMVIPGHETADRATRQRALTQAGDMIVNRFEVIKAVDRAPPAYLRGPGYREDIIINNIEGVVVRGQLMAIAYDVINDGADPFPLAQLRVIDEYRDTDIAGFVHFQSPFVGSDDLIATIPARSRVRGTVFLTTSPRLSAPLTLELIAPGGLQFAAAPAREWEFVPVTPKFEPEVSIQVEALVGAIWLGDGIDLEELDATSMRGLGVRASYDLSRRFAVEGAIAGASTGDAAFADVMYDGMQGDLARSATLGRVQFGGVLRLGEKIRPTLRLGLGLQAASHDAAFTPAGGGAVQEPDVGFEFDGLWYFGAGMDMTLGQHLLAGGGVAFNKSVSSTSRSLEAGVHLGYTWMP